MSSGSSERVRIWFFPVAPPDLRQLFRNADGTAWLAHVPAEQRRLAEPSLLQWGLIYPVDSVELPDRAVVYLGTPRGAVDFIRERGSTVTDALPAGAERRREQRLRIALPVRYQTHTVPEHTGAGDTIDLSAGGVSFTTESILPDDAELSIRVTWPVSLEGNVPIELRGVGRIAHTESFAAGLQLQSVKFALAD